MKIKHGNKDIWIGKNDGKMQIFSFQFDDLQSERKIKELIHKTYSNVIEKKCNIAERMSGHFFLFLLNTTSDVKTQFPDHCCFM